MNLTSMTPGSGVTLMTLSARIGRRRIAFDVHRQIELGGGRLDGGEQLEIVLEPLDRRHEHAEMPSRSSTVNAVRTASRVSGLRRRRCCTRASGVSGGESAWPLPA